MNESDVGDLLHEATRDLHPDVRALVAGGLRRGQVRQRRRRTARAVAGTVGAVLAVVIAGSQVLGPEGTVGRPGPADSTTAVDPAMPSRSTPTSTLDTRLAVTTEEVPSTFASLVPGRVSGPSEKSGPDLAPVVDFTWNGFGIRVGITPDDYITGRSVPDPARRCVTETDASSCRPGANQTVVSTYQARSPEVDGGTEVRWVKVFRPDGWDVLVSAYNGPAKEGPVTADEPPFTLAELERIAASDIWFR